MAPEPVLKSFTPGDRCERRTMDSCSNCASVHFVERRVHRHGSLAVALGHFLLVPSLLVVVLASMGVVSRPASQEESRRTSLDLEAAGIPAPVAERVAARQPLAESELDALTQDQQQSVLRAQIGAADGSTRASMSRFTSGGVFRLLVALSAAGGILGWFLLRKTRVAQCVDCGCPAAPAG